MSVDNRISEEERIKKLEEIKRTMTNIDKQFGKGSAMMLGDKKVEKLPVIPSGSYMLNEALGVGGFPRGRIIEVYGPESSGKTTLALHAIAEVQKRNGFAAFIDAEHALDPVYASALGVDLDSLIISQPDTGEEALEIAEQFARSSSVDLIVVDSVAALVPKAEIDGDMGASHVGLQARLMSQALRKITAATNKSNTTILFINQLREKVGVMFGSPETTTGGRALKFYSTIRLDIRRIETLKEGTNAVGNRVRVKVVKNKVAPPFKQAEFNISFGKGIDNLDELIEIGVKKDVINKAGAWFSYNSEKLGEIKAQGKPKFAIAIEETEGLLEELEEVIFLPKEESLENI